MTDPSPILQRRVGILALLGAAVLLTWLGGVTGALFGVAAVAAGTVTPPVFAFVFAQSGIAASVSAPYPPLIIVAEAILLVFLLVDPRLTFSVRSIGYVLLGMGILMGALWLVQPIALWLTAVGTLLGITGFIYVVHRFELLTTNQLTQQ